MNQTRASVLEGRLAAAFKAERETDSQVRTVPHLVGVLESKVSDLRASMERHGGRHIPLLLSSVRAYADLLEDAYQREKEAAEGGSQ